MNPTQIGAMSDLTTTDAIPVSFAGPMVSALLDGRKSMTRRVVKPQPGIAGFAHGPLLDGAGRCLVTRTREGNQRVRDEASFAEDECPYGQPGSILRVRESFRIAAMRPGQVASGFYLADGKQFNVRLTEREWALLEKWKKPLSGKPPMHCFRSLSRIYLEVQSVRVQRVQEITGEDAKAEGITEEQAIRTLGEGYEGAFRELWDGINAARGHGWRANPFVWCISFRRTTNAR